MKYLCMAYEEEQKLNALSQNEWDALRQETLHYLDELQIEWQRLRLAMRLARERSHE